jgi:hypothetical protein
MVFFAQVAQKSDKDGLSLGAKMCQSSNHHQISIFRTNFYFRKNDFSETEELTVPAVSLNQIVKCRRSYDTQFFRLLLFIIFCSLLFSVLDFCEWCDVWWYWGRRIRSLGRRASGICWNLPSFSDLW